MLFCKNGVPYVSVLATLEYIKNTVKSNTVLLMKVLKTTEGNASQEESHRLMKKLVLPLETEGDSEKADGLLMAKEYMDALVRFINLGLDVK